MPFQLSFTRREKYSSLAAGINLETTLRVGDLFINCDAKVDTGAEVCLFQRAIGEALDIPIENGVKKRLETLTGVLTAWVTKSFWNCSACNYKRLSISLKATK